MHGTFAEIVTIITTIGCFCRKERFCLMARLRFNQRSNLQPSKRRYLGDQKATGDLLGKVVPTMATCQRLQDVRGSPDEAMLVMDTRQAVKGRAQKYL
jgi:hypothetical protein